MKCLTDYEVKNYLQGEQYNSEAEYYLKFTAPKNYRAIDAFLRTYFIRFLENSESLIHVTDWSLYQQGEMIAVKSIRLANNEMRELIDASGHLLSNEESELAISIFSLCSSFEWSLFLHACQKDSTLYCWEGDIFEYWTDNESNYKEMLKLMKEFELNIVS